MQEDPSGVIPGNQAKEFFEKSSLPIAELRKIWQLSDVTMDGCLSLEEFLTAMHLVVLRRNNITLPDSLPTCLRPAFLKVKLEHSLKKQVKKDQLKETNLVSFKISSSLLALGSCALPWSVLSETCSFLAPF